MSARQRLCAVVTNDDGIESEGLRLLAGAALDARLDVVVAAPPREASGSGSAMTPISASSISADGRVVVERRKLAGLDGTAVYAVEALPAFIAFTAVRGAFGARPPMVLLSGINRGPNTGRAVLHSGTVAAAMTASLHGVPAAAFSLDIRGEAEPEQWETAVAVARQVIPALAGLRAGVVLNVNVPNVPLDRLRGLRQATLAAGGAVEVSIVAAEEDDLQVTVTEAAEQPASGTDLAALAAGYASLTALRPVCEATDADLAGLLDEGLTAAE
jgi:5'-nucleotidase